MFTVRSMHLAAVIAVTGLVAAIAAAVPAGGVTRPGHEGSAGPAARPANARVAPAPVPASSSRPAPASSSRSGSASSSRPAPAGCGSAPYGADFYAPDAGSGKTVALTFDDGPGPTTPGVLAVLRRYGVPATFFNIGQNAAAYPALVRQEAADGYLVGNHTWDHPDMPTLPAAEQAAELDEASAEQERLAGWGPCVFRPPYGDYSPTLLSLARQRAMTVWLWSVDTEDWEADGSDSSYWVNRIVSLAESEGGSQDHPVVLMHNAPSGDPATVAALPAVISYFRTRGYKFVSLDGATGTGYYVATSGGAVRSFDAPSPGGPVRGRAAGLAADPDTGGYWLLKPNGSVAAHDAPFYGQLSGQLPAHVTAVAVAADRGGYLVLTSDGGVHAFGAPYHGQPKGRLHALKPVALAVDAATGGYWILNSAGGVWTYDARDYGSLAGKHARVTAIAPSPKGGYLLLSATGRVFGFHAGVYGFPRGRLGRGVKAVALAVTPATGGYLILLSNGGVLGYHTRAHGSLAAALARHGPATAIAAI